MKHIFISYSTTDLNYLHQLVQYLKERNLAIWTDDDLKRRGANNWGNYLEDRIKESNCMVVLLSPNAKESHWVNQEIACALENNVQIFPVLIENNPEDSIPFALKTHQTYPIYSTQDKSLDLVVEAIQSRFIMEPPSNLDDYVIISLAHADLIKGNLNEKVF